MKQFLIIQTAFIGDVVLATALIEKLHQAFPEAQIDFLVRKGNEGLLQNHPFIRNLLIWNKKQSKYKHLFQLLKQIRQQEYDTIINVQRFAATGFLTAFGKAKESIGFDKNPWSRFFTKRVKHIISTAQNPLHEIDRNQRLIADFTDAIPEKPRLYPSAEQFAKVEGYKQQAYVCIAPGSVWFTKTYPKGKWIDFINSIPANITVYLLGGPTEESLCDYLQSESKRDEVINLAGELSFLESAALQKDAQMNYVNDSAPMHFASALNAPVTAVYCSTVPYFGFGPLSDKRFLVQIKEKLDCRPCGLHGYKACPKLHFQCAMDIENAQLLETLYS